ncbi:DUF5677 domain-containing protein [Terrisporobacter petrolearius]|uniref:DUF5677 domain-containing protein n=1 Tax=Terrisporobacter petrolearius TaxID=1460447 RepID=UPI0031CCC2D9
MIFYEYGNVIYKLTEEERELITRHNLFYEDLFKYGNKILDIGFKETIEDYELTIYSMIYRLLELLDTLKVMTENSLINSGFIVIRSLVEIAVQLEFILVDNDKMQEKATILQMLDIKRTAKDEVTFYESMEKKECYREYVSIIKIDKPYSNWYSYCERKRISLKDLFKLIGWENLYLSLYRPLCIETHGINHMESNIVFQNNQFNFKPFRVFENHVLLLNSVLTIMVPILHRLVELYGNEQLKIEWSNYKEKIEEYIKNNHNISETEKNFNPMLKWF